MFQFTYDSVKSFDDKGLNVQDVRRPILPPIDSATMEVAGMPGVIYFEEDYGPHEIPVTISFKKKSLKSVRETVRDLAAWLRPQGTRQLIFSDEPDRFYHAVLTGDTELEPIVRYREGQITFLAPDPFAYALNDDIFTYNAPGSYDFNRQGTAQSFPLIEVQGEMSAGDSITFEMNNNQIAYTGVLQGGESLFIDSARVTAYVEKSNGSTVSAINDLSNLDFPVTLPDVVNNFTISTAGAVNLTQVKLRCNSRWY